MPSDPPHDQDGPRTPYEACGGEAGIRRLVDRFYDLMESRPDAAAALAIHPNGLDDARQKLFEYLTGWLGGPPIFVERHGPPMLRARHLHAPIGEEEVEAWLVCFRQAWAETISDPDVTAFVVPRIEALARHMRNREPRFERTSP
ncbi:MAG: group II truncated hemoglobin [Alsobacter sp.]